MKLNTKNRINTILISAILIFLVLGCDAWVSLEGKVLDANSNPVSDAKIIVEQGGNRVVEEKSRKDGSYKTFGSLNTFPFAGKIKLTVTKEGFQAYEKIISNDDLELKKLDILLKNN